MRKYLDPAGNFNEFLFRLVIVHYHDYLTAIKYFGPDFLNKQESEIKDKDLYKQWYIRKKLELGKAAHQFFFDNSNGQLFEKICLVFGINVNAARENLKSIKTIDEAKRKLSHLHLLNWIYEREKKNEAKKDI
jgi:hypothetical protein